MPSKGSPDRSDDAAPAPDTTEWSANGVHADSAEVTDSPADDATSADAPEPTAEADADAELAPAEATDDVAAATDEDGSGFLNQLVRAMQTTAAAEKARVAAEIDRRREAHLAAVEARRLAEATTMLELADTDLKAIDSWAEAERHRIQAERERRATALQADLEASLATHGARIDDEITAVEAAIAAHRVEVDTFFAGLDAETDPIEIARHASQRPAFPALDAIGRETQPAAAAPESSDVAEAVPTAEADADAPAADAAAADDAIEATPTPTPPPRLRSP